MSDYLSLSIDEYRPHGHTYVELPPLPESVKGWLIFRTVHTDLRGWRRWWAVVRNKPLVEVEHFAVETIQEGEPDA